ncbi:unnamed protein product [Cochlearia groenlandica]
MAKERETLKKEKKEIKEKKKERKRREAEELEKKISKKKRKSEKPEKSIKKKKKKKSKRSEIEAEVEEEEKPRKKSKKETKTKKKHKRSDDSDESDSGDGGDEPLADDSRLVTVATNNNDSDLEFDKEDIKHILESYTKEDLVNLIYKTAEKRSRLISSVLESAERDSLQRNIFVRGLGWDTTHENLKAAFEVYGEIEECSVVMDKDTGRAKGYGFVLFKTRKGTREALRNPDKRMFNRTVSCNLAVAKPSSGGGGGGGGGGGKPREAVESVKIDLTQSELALPGLDSANVQCQQQNMAMYAGQNMPFYGHSQAPLGYNPMYGALMGNQMVPGLPNYLMFGSGMMNHGVPKHMGGVMAGQYVGEGNGGGGGGVGVGHGFDGESGWYMR